MHHVPYVGSHQVCLGSDSYQGLSRPQEGDQLRATPLALAYDLARQQATQSNSAAMKATKGTWKAGCCLSMVAQ